MNCANLTVLQRLHLRKFDAGQDQKRSAVIRNASITAGWSY